MQLGRAKNIVLQDKTEWPLYWASENDSASLMRYGITFILISNLLKMVGSVIFAAGFAFMGGWGIYFFALYIVTIILEIVALMFVPKIFSALAPSFGGTKSDLSSLKLYVYVMTPVWVGACFGFIPFVGGLVGLLGAVLGLYYLWIHAGEAMSVPEEKKVGYVLVSILIIFVIYLVIGGIAGVVVGGLAVGNYVGTGMWHH